MHDHSQLRATFQNENGFALTNFLIFLPVLLAIFVTIFAAFYIMKNEGQTRQICRTSTLSLQETVASHLNTLIRMNLGAKVLRATRKIADEAVEVAAAFPPAEAAALAFKGEVVAAQTAYGILQKGVIYTATAAQQAARLSIQYKLHQAMSRAHDLQNEGASQSALSRFAIPFFATDVSVNWPKFDVEASPKESLTPDYTPADDFAKNAEIHVKWKMNVAQLLPAWMQKILPNAARGSHARLSMGCGASVVESGDDDSSNDSSTNSDSISSFSQGSNSNSSSDAGSSSTSDQGNESLVAKAMGIAKDKNASDRNKSGESQGKMSEKQKAKLMATETSTSMLNKARSYMSNEFGGGKWAAKLNADK